MYICLGEPGCLQLILHLHRIDIVWVNVGEVRVVVWVLEEVDGVNVGEVHVVVWILEEVDGVNVREVHVVVWVLEKVDGVPEEVVVDGVNIIRIGGRNLLV